MDKQKGRLGEGMGAARREEESEVEGWEERGGMGGGERDGRREVRWEEREEGWEERGMGGERRDGRREEGWGTSRQPLVHDHVRHTAKLETDASFISALTAG